jgi:hypothetical protein
LGKPNGHISTYKKKAYKAVISLPNNKQSTKYFYYVESDSKEMAEIDAKDEAEIDAEEIVEINAKEIAEINAKAWIYNESKNRGLLHNLVRFIDGETIEVQLNRYKTMKTDAKFLDIVQNNHLCVKRREGKNDDIYYPQYITDKTKKTKSLFYRLITNYTGVKFLNGDTLDNRLSNMLPLGEVIEKDTSMGKDEGDKQRVNIHDYRVSIRNIDEAIRKSPFYSRNFQHCNTPIEYKDGERILINYNKFVEHVENKGGKCIGKIYDYKTAHSKLEVLCQDKHLFEICPNNVTQRWCPICSIGISEFITIKAIEHLFQAKFPKKRPGWLKTDTGTLLELDGYNEEEKIAIEYNGIQHYEKIDFFHRSDQSLDKRMQYDELKIKICREQDVILIIVPYYVDHKDICQYISDELKNHNLILQHRVKSFDVNKLTMPSKIEILKKIIEDKHGKLIGGTYVDSTSSITVKCDKGHTWNTKVKSIMIGNWCHTCAKIRDNESRKKISTTLIEYNKTDEGKQKKIESHAKRSATMKKERDEIIATQTDKKCGKCKNTKPNSAFNKKSDAKDKFQSQCKDCMNEVRRLIREKNKERVKNEGLRFECKICLSTFQLKDSLTRHIKNKHS